MVPTPSIKKIKVDENGSINIKKARIAKTTIDSNTNVLKLFRETLNISTPSVVSKIGLDVLSER